MRIAMYYDDYRRVRRNDGWPLYVNRVLKEMGHDVVHLIPDAKKLDGFGKFDLHIWGDWGEDGLKGIIDYEPIKIPHPGIYFASDTHLGYDYRLNKAKEADWVFCAQKEAVEAFKRDGIKNPIWSNHAFEPLAYPKIDAIKKWDVCFVGNLNSDPRIDFLDGMFKAFPDFWYGKRLFEEAARIYSQTRVCLNPPTNKEINMRDFEIMGSGNFLLTEDLPSLHDLFEDGKHLVLYKDLQDAIEKTKYYLAHDEERERIARTGYEEVISKHTYKHRVLDILKHCGMEQKEAVLCP